MKQQEKDYTNFKLISCVVLVVVMLIACIVIVGHEAKVKGQHNDKLSAPNIKGMIMLGIVQPEYLGEATKNDKPILIENKIIAQEAANGNVYGLFQDPFGRYFWSRIR